MPLPMIHSMEDLLALIEELGFLPFFPVGIPGFCVEACCPRELWFAADVDGPWEWKGPIARTGRCVYGKFFRGKAGFISREWFPDFANFRRDGYDFDARYDDGLASHKDKDIYDAIAQRGQVLSKTLKEACNYKKGGNKGFETVITRLQMQTYVNIADFVYMQDRTGKRYGWGVGVYSTPEVLLGGEAFETAYRSEPQEARQRILAHLRAVLPQVQEEQLERFLRG